MNRLTKLSVLGVVMLPLLLGSSAALRVEDFGGYWCGARLVLAGENPYDPAAMLRLEREIEPERDTPQMPWGPPWAFAIVAPLTLVDFALARWLWLGITAGALAWASTRLWQLYAPTSPDGENHAAFGFLTCFSFYPILLLLGVGQVSVLDPLALAGFLVLSQRRADFRAGLVLSLIAVKPQVVLLFALAALIWMVRDRRWRIMIGGMCGLAVQTMCVVWPNPWIFRKYVQGLRDFGPQDLVQPTPAMLLRMLADGAFWPSFLPLAAGAVWLAWRMVKHRPWDWRREMPSMSFACVLTSPHAWVYDFGVLLIPLQKTAAEACQRPGTRWFFFGIHLLATAAAFTMNLRHHSEFDYIWLVPLYLALYLLFPFWEHVREKPA